MASKYGKYYDPERQPIGYYSMNNFGGLALFDVLNGLDTYVIVGDYYEKPENIRKHKIYTTYSGRDYFVRFGQRYYFDEVMRVDFTGRH